MAGMLAYPERLADSFARAIGLRLGTDTALHVLELLAAVV
jgi:hypothetical protein